MEIQVSEKALNRIKEIQTDTRKPRIYRAGACWSGILLGLVVSEVSDDDDVVNVEGIDFMVQPDLDDCVSKVYVDYAESGIRMGFSVKNIEV